MSFGPQASPADEALGTGKAGRRSRILGGGRGGGTDGRRGVWIAMISTILVFGVITLLVVNSPGWPQIKQLFLNGEVFRDSFPEILAKFTRNIFIFVVAEVFVLILALLIAVMRSLPGPVFTPVRWIAIAYVDFFRGVPTILVIFVLGYGMPGLGLTGLPDSDLFWGIVALVLVYSAYVAEVYRAGIDSVHPSQTSAARSLGLSRASTMRYVILPQAIRRVIPPLLNDFIGLQKDSALLGLIGYTEAFRMASITSAADFNFTPFLVVALLFLFITIPMTRFVDWLVSRQQRRRQGGGLV